jgi:hypothetical protein
MRFNLLSIAVAGIWLITIYDISVLLSSAARTSPLYNYINQRKKSTPLFPNEINFDKAMSPDAFLEKVKRNPTMFNLL